MVKLGIDLGGTKIELIVLSERGEVLHRERVATPQGDYQATLQKMAELVFSADQKTGEKGSVGLGTPGALSKVTGQLKNSNSICLNGQPLLEDFQSLIQRPVRISNDANCFALSEAVDGAATGCEIVFGVIIGTGTGAGIVVNGKVLAGANAISGEWGHNSLPWPLESERIGRDCYCGRFGCIETWLSGLGMANDHEQVSGQKLIPQEILNRAGSGCMKCEQTLLRYENRLARSLAHVINLLDPDAIVLGGGLSNIQRLYKNIPKLWGDYVFSDRVDTRLVAAKYGDSSGVRGAAWLWGKGAG